MYVYDKPVAQKVYTYRIRNQDDYTLSDRYHFVIEESPKNLPRLNRISNFWMVNI